MTSPSKDISTKAHPLIQNQQQMALGVWDAYLETNWEQGYRKSTGFIQIKRYKVKETAGINWYIFTEVYLGRHFHFYW